MSEPAAPPRGGETEAQKKLYYLSLPFPTGLTLPFIEKQDAWSDVT